MIFEDIMRFANASMQGCDEWAPTSPCIFPLPRLRQPPLQGISVRAWTSVIPRAAWQR